MKPFRVNCNSYLYDIDLSTKRGLSMQVHISDIHFGVIDPKVEYDILKEQFINKIAPLPMDCISIDGDLFDRLFMSNTDATLYANLFFRDLYDICKANSLRGIHTVLLLLMGTKNHDSDQLRLFYPYLNDPDVDVRIVENIRYENINGCKVLCIPELYNVPNKIYQYYLYENGYYDMVFMHGTIKGAVYDNGGNLGNIKVFDNSDFGYCLGPVVAGHVHPGGNYNSYCFYNGSPIRWAFGEENTKGFQIVLYNMDTREYYVHLEPITSFKYITLDIDDIIMSDPDQIISYINSIRAEQHIDYIRLKVRSTNDNMHNIEVLKKYYSTDKTVKFKIDKSATNVVAKNDKQTEELYNKYSYLFDKSMSQYEIFAKFVNDNEGDIIVSADDIIQILRDDM